MERKSGSRPKSWMYFFLGYSLLTAIALMAAVLFVQFIQNRPSDIRRHCTYLANQLENVLYEYLPERNIRRDEGEERSDKHGRWLFYRFNVIETPQIKAEGMTDIIRKAMNEKGVRILDSTPPGGQVVLTASIYDRDFAEISFGPAQNAVPERTDLRRRCQGIAREAEETLLRAGVPAANIVRSQPEDRKDDKVLWSFSAIDVTLPETVAAAALRERLDQSLAALEGIVSGDDTASHISYQDKECVEIRWKPAGAAKPSEASPQSPNAATETTEALAPGAALPSMEELPLDSVDHPTPDANGVPPAGRETPRSPGEKPRVAIILDDGGYTNPDTEPALSLDSRLTFAILPGTRFDEKLARKGKELGFEIILHMPMQTHGRAIKPFPGEVNVQMDEAAIRENTLKAIAEIPGLVGVNNHTGSKFSSDRERMTMFLTILKDKGLFFVDSKTIASSVGRSVAEEIGVPSAERDVFLDNESDPAKITEQFNLLVARAKKKGQAIGIGHFRKNTVATLADLLPKLETEGIALVHVSGLVK